MKEKSEFPETNLIKVSKKIGWIFSPVLFIALLFYTFFSAQGLKLDLTTGNVERIGYIDINEVSESDVFFDNVKVGNTSVVLTTDKTENNQEPLVLRVQKPGKRTWEKSIKPKEGFVSILYPVMYPEDLRFDYANFEVLSTYNSPNPNIFFYEKVEGNRVILYRYFVQRQLFGILIRDGNFADISNFVIKNDFLSRILAGSNNITSDLLKSRSIYPSHFGRSVLISLHGERALLIDDAGRVITIPNYVPNAEDQIFWSPNDDYVFVRSGKEIFSVEVNTNTVAMLYRSSSSSNEQVEIQFVTEASIVYKVISPTNIDLLENTFQGNNQQNIDIPNVDGLRRNNLKKAYEMVDRQNIILLQTENNIYSYNLTTFEIKKFNKFDGEEIIYVDSLKQVVVTMNNKAKNQFRTYSLEQDDSKTFAFEDIEKNIAPENIRGFNYSRNIVLQYPSKVIITDNDGANVIKYEEGVDLRNVLVVKEDRWVVFVMSTRLQNGSVNSLGIKVARFEN